MTLAIEFARSFNKAVRSFRMYSPTHPQVQVDLKDAFSWLEKMTAVEPSVALGARDGVMIVQGRPVHEMTATLKAFVDSLTSRGLTSFSSARPPREFSASSTSSSKARAVMESTASARTPQASITSTSANSFVALRTEFPEAVGAVGGGEQQQELMQLISAFVGGETVTVGGGGSSPGGAGAEGRGRGGGCGPGTALAPVLRTASPTRALGERR